MKSFDKTQDKKILIFSIAYIPFVGGAELAVKEITDRIGNKDFSAQGGPARGWHFDLITLRFDKKWPKTEKIGNITIYRIGGPKLFFPFSALFKGLSLHKKYEYQIIWSIMANRAGFAALFFKFFLPKVKFLLTLQEGDVLDYPQKRAGVLWPFVGFLFKRIFRKADYIQAISNYLAAWARQMGFRKRLEIVPNGVDLENFNPPAGGQISRLRQGFGGQANLKISELKEKLNIKNGEKILITTSRLVSKNAVDDIIRALQYLPENVKFLILGVGSDLEKLQNLAEEIGVREKVIFLGHIEPQEVPKYLAISDVFVRPSLSEGLGSSFLEAMAAGIPVIATPVGGIPDFLKDGETGLFCEVRNPKSIAEKVKIILEDAALAGKIKNNANEMVAKKYDWDLISRKMGDIFNKLLAPLEIQRG